MNYKWTFLIGFLFLVDTVVALGFCNLPIELSEGHYFLEGRIIGFDSIKSQRRFYGEYFAPVVRLKITKSYFGKNKYKDKIIEVEVTGTASTCSPYSYPMAPYFHDTYPEEAIITFVGILINEGGLALPRLSINGCYQLLMHKGKLKKMKKHNFREYHQLWIDYFSSENELRKVTVGYDRKTVEAYSMVRNTRLLEMKSYSERTIPPRLQIILDVIELKNTRKESKRLKKMESILYSFNYFDREAFIMKQGFSQQLNEFLLVRDKEIIESRNHI